MLQIADVDEIYTFGRCIEFEYAQNPNDNFDTYETWLLEDLEYLIGRKETEEGRTSIILSTRKKRIEKEFIGENKTIAVRFSIYDYKLIKSISINTGQDVSNFIRFVVKKELAKRGFLSNNEKKALGVKLCKNKMW